MPQDERLSMVWLAESARQGVAAASWQLYQRHVNGEGVDESEEQAELWLKQAAEDGSAEARDVYARRQGDDVTMPKITELADIDDDDDAANGGSNGISESTALQVPSSPLVHIELSLPEPEPASEWAPPAAGSDWKAQVASSLGTVPGWRADAPSPATVGNNATKAIGSDGSSSGNTAAAAAVPSDPGAFLPGIKVEVIGLTANVALNGRVGVVKAPQRTAKPGRVAVLLEGEKKSKAIRAENLRILYVVAGGAMPLLD